MDLPAAEVQRLSPQDLTVTFHAARTVGLVDRLDDRLCVSVDPACAVGLPNSVSVLSICGAVNDSADLGGLTKSMRSWQCRPKLRFGLRDFGLSAHASSMLEELVLQRAFPACALEQCVVVHSSQRNAEIRTAAVHELRQHKAVEQRLACPGSAAAHWCFTPFGARQLMHMHEVRSPECVFRDPATLAVLPIDDVLECSSWELLQMLQHQGWVIKKAPAKLKDRRGLQPVTSSTLQKVFFLASVHTSSKPIIAYLKVLCASAELFARGELEAVYHAQPEKYYLSILQEGSNGQIAEEMAAIEGGAGDAAELLDTDIRLEIEDNVALDKPEVELAVIRAADPLEALASQVEAANESGSDSGASVVASLFSETSFGYEPSYADPDEDLSLHEVASRAQEEAVPAPPSEPEAKSVEKAAIPTARRAERLPRQEHPLSFNWGVFRFTYTPPDKRPPHGQFQATCPYHKLSAKTNCTRATQIGPCEESKDLAVRALQTWCLLGPCHDRKRRHAAAFIAKADILPREALDAKMQLLPQPPLHLRTDEELDALEESEGGAGAASAAKAKPKAKGKAKGKAAAKKRKPSKPPLLEKKPKRREPPAADLELASPASAAMLESPSSATSSSSSASASSGSD